MPIYPKQLSSNGYIMTQKENTQKDNSQKSSHG